MTRHATVTRAGVLAMMARQNGATLTQSEVGAMFGVTAEAAGNVLRSLVSTRDLVLTKKSAKFYYALPVGGKAADTLATPFKPDLWKAPLKNYNLFSHRDLAMAART